MSWIHLIFNTGEAILVAGPINPYQAELFFNLKAPNAELFWTNLVFLPC